VTVPEPNEGTRTGPVIRRQTARVLPVDPEGRALLLHGWDPHRPEDPFWFTIGGAADEGASLRDAAVRELYEETRISVAPEHLGEPIAQNEIEFFWGGHRIAQDQTFFAVAVTSTEVSLEGLDDWERATTDKYGWLSADELADGERSAHPDIPDLIRTAVLTVRNRPATRPPEGRAHHHGSLASYTDGNDPRWSSPRPGEGVGMTGVRVPGVAGNGRVA
jgi:8-oxo-dGTP pyrophosphatase MutT (NUDIX family)